MGSVYVTAPQAGVAKALARLERAFTEMESLKSDLKGLLGESRCAVDYFEESGVTKQSHSRVGD